MRAKCKGSRTPAKPMSVAKLDSEASQSIKAVKVKKGTKRPAETPITAVDDAVASPSEAGSDAARVPLLRGSSYTRKAAQRVKSYKDEDAAGDEDMEDVETLKVKEVVEAATEAEALAMTASVAASSAAAAAAVGHTLRCLVDFSLGDSEGRLEPLDRLSSVQGGLFISGRIEPLEARTGPGGSRGNTGSKAKNSAAGQQLSPESSCRVNLVGPVKEWHVSYSANANPKLVLSTDRAQYECGKPSPSYRKLLEPLMVQLELAGAVHRALSPEAGGRMDASFNDVCCHVGRMKVSKQYGGARFALKLNGRFILEQLVEMAAASKQGAPKAVTAKGKETEDRRHAAAHITFDNGPFAQGLTKAMESEDHMPLSKESLAMIMGPGNGGGGGIRIMDGGKCNAPATGGDDGDAAVDEDYELACRLMAEEYALHMNGGSGRAAGSRRGRGNAGGGRQEPYIQVRQEEIADDYPAPKEYKGEDDEEEWDELELEDQDLVGSGFYGADDPPEVTDTLDNFAIYNSEGLLTTLELVPMVAVDADVNVFASGAIGQHGGDERWLVDEAAGASSVAAQGGDSTSGVVNAGGTGAGGSGGDGTSSGQRYYLTQIREWFVECGPGGQTVINIRTDVSWYRLLRPQKRYAAWYRVVQRAANIAVQILTWLDEQDRAARLSFSDVVARLAGLPPGHAAHVAAKVDAVERFLVVHGQVILNLFRRHYKETIRNCGFGKTLRIKLGERRHRKLTTLKARREAPGRIVERDQQGKRVQNPVKVRQEGKTGKPQPMPATATAQVRRIWLDYFNALEAMQQRQQARKQQQPELESAVKEDSASVTVVAASSAADVDVTGCTGVTATAWAAQSLIRLSKSKSWILKEPQTKGELAAGRTMYGAAVCGDLRLVPGSVVRLGTRTFIAAGNSDDEASEGSDDNDASESGDAAAAGQQTDADGEVLRGAGEGVVAHQLPVLTRGPFALVQCIFTELAEDGESSPRFQVRRLVHGRDTMLADGASSSELFLLDRTPMPAVPSSRGGSAAAITPMSVAPGDMAVLPLNGRAVAEVLEARYLSRPARHNTRLAESKADLERLQHDRERLAADRPPVFVYRTVYCPLQGKFRELRLLDLGLGSYVKEAPPSHELELLPGGGGFIKDGVTYRVGDFLYVRAEAVTQDAGSDVSSSGTESGSDSESEEDDSEDEEKEVEEDVGGAARRTQHRAHARRQQQQARGKKAADASATVEVAGRLQQRSAKGAEAGKARKGFNLDKGQDKEEEDGIEEQTDSRTENQTALLPSKKKRASIHKGSNMGLRAFAVVQLWAVESSKDGAGADGSGRGAPSRGSKSATASVAGAASLTLQVHRFYRPEDISREVTYRADWWDLYMPPYYGAEAPVTTGSTAVVVPQQPLTLPIGEVYGKCTVVIGRSGPKSSVLDTFHVVGSYDPRQPGKIGPSPTSLPVPPPPTTKEATTAEADASGKGNKRKQQLLQQSKVAAAAGKGRGDLGVGMEESCSHEEGNEVEVPPLDSLDIFAGCGGLSEGMHQAGVANTRWAIEYDSQAAEAFKLNNPNAKVFCNNCNVLLQAAMVKAGLETDCLAHPSCEEAAAKLDQATINDLPIPGSVELMMGGPPCQGYSGMNRFNRGLWSQVQNSMVMAYLSYCDFYRPRYFLLENVRNFAVYRSGEVFRLVVRTLLDLGYQVRFGILNAGHYGAPQSRKRTFIWAVLPGEMLPDWPAPRHVFLSTQLGVRMLYPGGSAAAGSGCSDKSLAPQGGYFYATGPPLPGAPLRSVTVHDAIGDLPSIDNTAKEDQLVYTSEPASAFQRAIRGSAGSLVLDHIVKPMNELNLERCRCIPKGIPGADWRELQRIVAADPSRELYQGEPLVPFCLPNTADRHNGWRGLYGRLDPDGHFPTATTEPNPMGKVGQVFHPDQDRIVSVRECARSQGFPDHFRFYGNVHCRHRQVGNAVPPPLARALGQQLRLALKAKINRDKDAAARQLQALRARRHIREPPLEAAATGNGKDK